MAIERRRQPWLSGNSLANGLATGARQLGAGFSEHLAGLEIGEEIFFLDAKPGRQAHGHASRLRVTVSATAAMRSARS
jgi:hypothetical protein